MPALPRLRRILASASAGALATAMAAAGAQANDNEQLLEAKVAPEILSAIDEAGTAELWLRFPGSPDWSEALAADTKEDKGEAAVAAAHEYAEESQAGVIAALEDAGADYESFWGSSTVKVTADQDLLEELASRDDIAEILEAPEHRPARPVGAEAAAGESWTEQAAPEQAGPGWNLDQIQAPDVWAEGFTGEGIVIADIDSGVDYTHPALQGQYRGNNGDSTFTHDYNFYDVSGECDGVPCDPVGTGTFSMGTMVGDDGQGNQIGVAPGAKWIAVTLGDWSLESIMAAGEWVAAPTDSLGENPDPAMAPHVVNNSWSTPGGYDPFYEDVVELWETAGIVPVAPTGDTGGFGCGSAGSPGNYPNVIAVGATDENRDVPYWSGKGDVFTSEIKPDLVAPGDMVRSSVPGGDYTEASGTAMASPHVAGTIALLMSASPELEGDYAAVYEALTDNAYAMDDRSCGGLPTLNYVYGHGITDAYAAFGDVDLGAFGSLSGTVTDDSDEPVEGARLFFDGDVDRIAVSHADGGYSFGTIPAGMYDVTVTRFLHEAVTGTVTVTEDQAAVFDAEMPAIASRTVEGVVVDGGGHGWPLAARVRTAHGEATATTAPLTGEFSIVIPATGDWPLTVAAAVEGYETIAVDPDDAALVSVPTAPGCTAPGYGSDTLQEDFETFDVPVGWTVVNRGDEPWHFDYPADYRRTNGSGGFAIADSDFAGPTAAVDTDMISPVFDLSAASEPVLNFANYFVDLEFGSDAEILITVDGGTTWERAWYRDEDTYATDEAVDLSAWSSATAAQLMFRYNDNGNWAWSWQVDAVKIGCDPLPGGLVTGTVTDSATSEPVIGALVADPATGATAATDENGRYVLFTDAGQTTLEATADGIGTGTAAVEVIADDVVGADITLQ
ncbi:MULTISPECIES: S8 family serine peptidase [Glycomyces]|uniref:Subtilisin family serine protease n=2 Tax=Glycomyces TaxID=58113 RepID=A0ABU2ATD9_9ACTN|nr:S8 family serine peptidase [Glycomyces lechevalierae]MDR7340492.1 subtilisin family serine protease [Glycomyces lechevalierae]